MEGSHWQLNDDIIERLLELDFLLITIGINSIILFNISEALKKISDRRTFLKTLLLQLITPYMEQRRKWPTLSTNIRKMINAYLLT